MCTRLHSSFTCSLYVQQIRDTVELWRLPNQRKISLRFLASYILKEDIQVRLLLATVAVLRSMCYPRLNIDKQVLCVVSYGVDPR
jgi:hypothetical protein